VGVPLFLRLVAARAGEAGDDAGSAAHAGSDAVRDFVLDNVRMWLEEFQFDGLRLDAVHAIYDIGARHLLRAAILAVVLTTLFDLNYVYGWIEPDDLDLYRRVFG